MENFTLSELAAFITNVGFPVVVAVWFMTKGHKTTEATNAAIIKMTAAIDNNTSAIERIHCKKAD